MRPTPPLLRRVRRLKLTTKQGPVGYYKGNRTGSMGRHTKHGEFIVDYRKVRTYVCPAEADMKGFKLTPFVSRRIEKPTYYATLHARTQQEVELDNELKEQLEWGNELSERPLYRIHREEPREDEGVREGLLQDGTEPESLRAEDAAAERLSLEDNLTTRDRDLLTLPDPRLGPDGKKPNWMWHWSTGQGYLLSWLKANPDRRID